jgi:hypothetical protein
MRNWFAINGARKKMQTTQAKSRSKNWMKTLLLVGGILLPAVTVTYFVDAHLHDYPILPETQSTMESGPPPTFLNPLVPNSERFAEGHLAPNLDLPSISGGKMLHLSKYRGVKPVVLVFASFT